MWSHLPAHCGPSLRLEDESNVLGGERLLLPEPGQGGRLRARHPGLGVQVHGGAPAPVPRYL